MERTPDKTSPAEETDMKALLRLAREEVEAMTDEEREELTQKCIALAEKLGL